MRSLMTALETYRLEHNVYPPAGAGEVPSVDVRLLTTPVAYLISPADQDPFKALFYHAPSATWHFVWDTFWIWLAITLALVDGTMNYLRKQRWGKERQGDETSCRRSWGRQVGLRLLIYLPSMCLFYYLILVPAADYDPPMMSHANKAWIGKPHRLGYAMEAKRFILVSVGPDGRSDIPDPVQLLAHPEKATWYEYDPSNGLVSGGDMIRWSMDLGEPQPIASPMQ